MSNDKIRQHNMDVIDKKRSPNWKVLSIILFAPTFATLTLFILHFIPSIQDSNTLYWILFAIFVPTLVGTIFVLQKYDLVGSYGETIILLIPTLIWLLPGSIRGDDDGIGIWWTILLAFSSLMIMLVSVAATMWIYKLKKVSRTKKVLSSTLAMRFIFIFASITSTLMISLILIYWGHHSLHLMDAKGVSSLNQQLDTSSTSWILFIIINSIVVAVTLVGLGLYSRYHARKQEEHVKLKKEIEDQLFQD